MDSITLLALSFTAVAILVSLGFTASLIADGLHNWHKERQFRNRPRGATRRAFK